MQPPHQRAWKHGTGFLKLFFPGLWLRWVKALHGSERA